MIFTLTKNPIEYYSNIRNHMTNCYLAEDVYQIIIGIDCDYVDSNSYSYDDLQKFYYSSKEHSNAPFAGLFGVFAYETIHYFENINEIKNEQYKFPTFLFANAKAYLHYDKNSKIYTFYGDKDKYLNLLENTTESNENEFYYNIESDLEHEKEHFYNMVEVARDYIKSGDIFQVVLSSQLKLETNLDSLSFYKELSIQNPSPYMFHFPTEYGDVVGSSPEILVQIENEEIFIAPIAGTRPRGKDSNEDDFLSHDLLNDEKECAEHRMLIDLARNDVGKFAESGSVVVRKPMHIQYYQHVMHIVSEVYGKKRKDISLFEKINIYTGKYHVLGELISPLEGIGPDDVNISCLISRIDKENIEEIILALKPSIEGETTMQYIKKILENKNIKITRIATGIPMGTDIDYIDAMTLEFALEGRKDI